MVKILVFNSKNMDFKQKKVKKYAQKLILLFRYGININI